VEFSWDPSTGADHFEGGSTVATDDDFGSS
jgi:hypothetical protein